MAVVENIYKEVPTNEMSAIQHEIELQQRHLKTVNRAADYIGYTNIKLGIKSEYNSNLNSNSINTVKWNVECPPVYRQINSHEHYMNLKIPEPKNNNKKRRNK